MGISDPNQGAGNKQRDPGITGLTLNDFRPRSRRIRSGDLGTVAEHQQLLSVSACQTAAVAAFCSMAQKYSFSTELRKVVSSQRRK